MSSRPWIPDEKGNKMEIPKELYATIRKLIKEHHPSSNQEKISFHPIPKGEKINLFVPIDKTQSQTSKSK
jgi:hypothetical protein